jgi:hypothetical protein
MDGSLAPFDLCQRRPAEKARDDADAQKKRDNPDALYRENSMIMGIAIGPVVALIAGILILFMPRLLNYIVALYLIIVGILGLLPAFAPGVKI